MARCRVYADWLAMAENANELPADLASHARSCPDCCRAWTLYAGAVDALTAGTDEDVAGPPDLDALRTRARPEPVPRASRRTAWLLAPLAAAAVAAGLWVAWPATDPAPVDPRAAGTMAGATDDRTGGAPGTGPDDEADPRVELVRAGQWLRAGANGVSVSDPAIASVTLAPGSLSRVDAWSDRDVRLFLVDGRMELAVTHRSPGSRFEVRTDLAIVRVVGTRFVVDHRPGIVTVVTGIEGRVAVFTADDLEIARLGPGQVVRVGPGVGARPGSGVDACEAAGDLPVKAPAGAHVRSATKGSEAVLPRVVPTGTTVPAEAALARARALMRMGQDLDAVKVLTEALAERTEGRQRLLAVLGDAWRLAGRPAEARAAYESALGDSPREAPEGVLPDLATLHEAGGALDQAALAWRSYLVAWPGGSWTGRALWSLADLAERSARPDEAMALWRRLLVEAPRAAEAPAAFAKVGRLLADAGRLDEADSWFLARDGDPDPAIDESSLVGRMRTGVLRRDPPVVRALADVYGLRHPAGDRRDEVRRLLESVDDSQAPAGTPR